MWDLSWIQQLAVSFELSPLGKKEASVFHVLLGERMHVRRMHVRRIYTETRNAGHQN